MRIRLERILIGGVNAPMSPGDVITYFHWYLAYPKGDLDPILVEECGSDRYGRLYVIRDGRHRFAASMLAGRKDILAQYKGVPWQQTTTPTVSDQDNQSASNTQSVSKPSTTEDHSTKSTLRSFTNETSSLPGQYVG